ncbi:ATP-binding protein [Streptomyces albipurpureus]|nr:ATP-binding protein [Streptomyces sp. CWNU-1]
MRTAVVYACAPDAAGSMSLLRDMTRAAQERGYTVRAGVSDTAELDVALTGREGWRSVSRIIRDGDVGVLVVASTAELAGDAAGRAAVLKSLASLRVEVVVVRPAAWEVSHWLRNWLYKAPPPNVHETPDVPGTRLCRAVFPAQLAHAGAARALVTDALRSWGCVGLSSEWDEAALAVNELIVNAIRHGSPVPGDLVAVSVERGERGLRVLVEDRSSALPRPRAAGSREESGRGLEIVAEIADDWGAVPHAERPGKTVWMLFRTTAVQPARAGSPVAA